MWVIYIIVYIEYSFSHIEYPKAICTFMLVLFILICFGACGIEAQTRRIPADENGGMIEIGDPTASRLIVPALAQCGARLD
ncbi:hypothetical protein CsSME_00030242 [Camellia sinensis var. sinensis]